MPTPEASNQAPEKSSLTPKQIGTLANAPDTFAKNKDLLKTLLTEEDYNFIANKIGDTDPKSESLETEEIPFESI